LCHHLVDCVPPISRDCASCLRFEIVLHQFGKRTAAVFLQSAHLCHGERAVSRRRFALACTSMLSDMCHSICPLSSAAPCSMRFDQKTHKRRTLAASRFTAGIDSSTITFKDNKALLDMVLARPVGLFALLDEECRIPRSSTQVCQSDSLFIQFSFAFFFFLSHLHTL
jgi:hypothetical protein